MKGHHPHHPYASPQVSAAASSLSLYRCMHVFASSCLFRTCCGLDIHLPLCLSLSLSSIVVGLSMKIFSFPSRTAWSFQEICFGAYKKRLSLSPGKEKISPSSAKCLPFSCAFNKTLIIILLSSPSGPFSYSFSFFPSLIAGLAEVFRRLWRWSLDKGANQNAGEPVHIACVYLPIPTVWMSRYPCLAIYLSVPLRLSTCL